MSTTLSSPTVTVAEFVAVAAAGFGPSTARTYRPYWRLLVARHGDTPIAEVGLGDLELVVADAVARARQRRPDTAARAPRESCVTALRGLFRRAHASGLTTVNPAAGLVKPRRARSRRRALDQGELAQLVDAVRTTSRDPGLDLLLLRFHLETGARRQGALNLTGGDLDAARSTVWLREKDDGEREQPVSPSLLGLLDAHCDTRGGTGCLFRTRDGAPVTARRYDTLFGRVRTALAWTDRVPVSAHVLRHTAITAVARHGGYPVAQAFAGHTPPAVTGRYIHATLAEIAAVIADLTGELHPLAPRAALVVSRCERQRVLS
jgi:integrase